MKKYIVIPTYNESENIQRIIEAIFALHPDFHIIVVDDNSPDKTGDITDALSRKDSRILVLHRPEKAGLGTAYVEGFKSALEQGAELIFEMDADFSHDPIYLKDFIKAAEKFDVVLGSRYLNGVRVEGWRFRRLLLSKFANIFVSYLMVKPIWDFTGGFRCYHRKVLEALDLDLIHSDGYAFQIEMLYLAFKHKFRVCEVPIIFKERHKGYSKISKNVIWEAFRLTFKFRAPLKKIFKHSSFLFKDYNEFVEGYYQDLENHE
ncbi:MAG: polyprenol monophosphomannose synthase [Candidatus Omnitrophota bacterium]